ncbi:hypothetical protein BTO05_12255 [Winogradskyella sp. PC-19]|uniref:DUF7672 family protein n=1 Tax=Winogradskyella sp. PC-19 TaxID=754417 RepID=UPI000B3C8319|nr:hypothetical protein [Winogradskyella sp. PC-19]ARV10375.1 hypothetical protein BTO05_12255 [Winogradskyella sp. PC-19]RZN74611.1 MAG: hypothetical protein EVB12_08125 [Winogradskyella sp.]
MMRIYFIGIFILLTAIVANFIAYKLNIMTWYGFIEFLTASGEKEIVIRIIDYVWLFLAYPIILGFGYWIGDKMYQFLFS